MTAAERAQRKAMLKRVRPSYPVVTETYSPCTAVLLRSTPILSLTCCRTVHLNPTGGGPHSGARPQVAQGQSAGAASDRAFLPSLSLRAPHTHTDLSLVFFLHHPTGPEQVPGQPQRAPRHSQSQLDKVGACTSFKNTRPCVGSSE